MVFIHKCTVICAKRKENLLNSPKKRWNVTFFAIFDKKR